MREEEFVKAVEGAGGTVYLVGGWVRRLSQSFSLQLLSSVTPFLSIS